MASAKLSRQQLPQAPGVLVIAVSGDVDGSNSDEIERFFDSALEQDKPQHVLLDLTGLTFASTEFYSCLVFWRDELGRRGGKLVLYGLPAIIASTLRIFSLDRVLTNRPDQAAALAELR
jgi:anti-anti-sigma factor